MNIAAYGVDTINLGAGHTSGNDTVTFRQVAIGSHITNWLSNDTADLSIAAFTNANAIYGGSGSGTIAAQSAHTETVVAFATGAATAGEDVFDMGGTTFANAAALATYLDANTITFASGTVPAGGASLLVEYSDGTNVHLALVHLNNGAVDTSAATATDIVVLVGVSSTSSLHNIHLVA
ncbi:MAG: hypothetical protein JO002_08025 [Burkholderiaceae bacterium]|nr:hypothetical protein [Burkholderiaceae bacterium]